MGAPSRIPIRHRKIRSRKSWAPKSSPDCPKSAEKRDTAMVGMDEGWMFGMTAPSASPLERCAALRSARYRPASKLPAIAS